MVEIGFLDRMLDLKLTEYCCICTLGIFHFMKKKRGVVGVVDLATKSNSPSGRGPWGRETAHTET